MYYETGEAKLIRDPPYLVNHDGTPYEFTDDVGEGWKALCIKTFGDIADIYDKHSADLSRFSLLQIKEKWGRLAIYLGGMSPAIFYEVHSILEDAAHTSLTICEMCGKPARPREGGWIKTLCDTHAKGLGRRNNSKGE